MQQYMTIATVTALMLIWFYFQLKVIKMLLIIIFINFVSLFRHTSLFPNSSRFSKNTIISIILKGQEEIKDFFTTVKLFINKELLTILPP